LVIFRLSTAALIVMILGLLLGSTHLGLLIGRALPLEEPRASMEGEPATEGPDAS
jgi:hypothetical protein